MSQNSFEPKPTSSANSNKDQPAWWDEPVGTDFGPDSDYGRETPDEE